MKITVKKLILTFKEFLIVWINQILYYNHIYPHEIFEQFKSFNLIIYKIKNPNFKTYINDLIKELIKHLIINRSTQLLELNVIIFNQKSNKLIKSYIINFNDILAIGLNDLIVLNDDELNNDYNEEHNDDDDDEDVDDGSAILNEPNLSWHDIYLQFNTLLYDHINELKRNQINQEINDLFFKVIVNVPKSNHLNTLNWVRLNNDKQDNQNQKSNKNQNLKPLQPIRFKPIGQINLYLFNFDIHNEYS